MRTPLDLARGEPPSWHLISQTSKSYSDYPIYLRSELWKIHNEARKIIQRAAQRTKASYDKTSNYVPFALKQQVWLHTPLRVKGLTSPKLQSHWTGPWEIIKILSDTVCRIQLLENKNKIQHVNIDWPLTPARNNIADATITVTQQLT